VNTCEQSHVNTELFELYLILQAGRCSYVNALHGRLTMCVIMDDLKDDLSDDVYSYTNNSKKYSKYMSTAAIDGWDNVLY
jgi:hypothetical protein